MWIQGLVRTHLMFTTVSGSTAFLTDISPPPPPADDEEEEGTILSVAMSMSGSVRCALRQSEERMD